MKQFERVLLVPGVTSTSRVLKKWRKYFVTYHPHIEVITLQKFYFHFQHKKVDTLVEEVVETLTVDKQTLVIGHSFGGIVICAALARLQSVSHIEVVTLGSPHEMNWCGVGKTKAAINAEISTQISITSFGGYFDPIVPFWKSEHPQSKKHLNLQVTHWEFVFSTKTIEEVMGNL